LRRRAAIRRSNRCFNRVTGAVSQRSTLAAEKISARKQRRSKTAATKQTLRARAQSFAPALIPRAPGWLMAIV
jgi:hypothetical protein